MFLFLVCKHLCCQLLVKGILIQSATLQCCDLLQQHETIFLNPTILEMIETGEIGTETGDVPAAERGVIVIEGAADRGKEGEADHETAAARGSLR